MDILRNLEQNGTHSAYVQPASYTTGHDAFNRFIYQIYLPSHI